MKIEITANRYNALLANTGRDGVRYYLHGIFVDTKHVCMVATDGYALLRVPVTLDGDGETPDTRIYASTGKAPKNGSVLIDLIEDTAEMRLKSGKVKKTIKLDRIDGKFPDYRSVIPDNIDPERDQPSLRGDCCFNPSLMSRTLEALEPGEIHQLQTFHADKGKGPIVCRVAKHKDLTLIVMPCRY